MCGAVASRATFLTRCRRGLALGAVASPKTFLRNTRLMDQSRDVKWFPRSNRLVNILDVDSSP